MLWACRGNDEEKAFLKGPPPPVEESVWDKTSRELKKNWWMWATVAFVVLLLGSLYMFRDSIYSSDTHGLPVIAGRPPSLSCWGWAGGGRCWVGRWWTLLGHLAKVTRAVMCSDFFVVAL